ncbi:MAG: ABC-2 transporter permease [Arachnia propionica]|uniref:ABC-2 transporter permease n=1 Tax=Arachnia propionica TaxID=1750 RepID=UPI00270BB562|nr:ABC-2 transporter permease [Arachnia propionica]
MRELTAMVRLDLRGLREMVLMVPIVIGVFWLLNWNAHPTWVISAMMILIFMMTQSLFRFGLFAAKVPLLDVLPVRRRTVVVSHYLMILASSLMVCLVGAVIFLVLQGVGVVVPQDWGMQLLASLGAMLLVIGLIVPHWWRPWRSWRTAVAHLPLFGVVCLVVILIAAHTTGNLPPAWSSFLGAHGPWLLLVIGVSVLAGSLPVTLRTAERLDH